ncbi:Hypothetical predicted protein, partial [Marmota monax]
MSFVAMRCPSGSHYNYCTSPCPATCLSLRSPMKCPSMPCVEGCECHGDFVLSGTSCVPLSLCGCTDSKGFYHTLGESWYLENTCTTLCTCSIQNNITCQKTTCKSQQTCRALDGLFRCRASDVGVCRVSGGSQFVSFDGVSHKAIVDICTQVLVKVCHPNMNLPFFKISAKSYNQQDSTSPISFPELYINIFNSKIILKKKHQVLINDATITLPATSQIPGVSITSSGTNTLVDVDNGLQVRFDGNQFLEVKVPVAYYDKVCGVCGNFNGEVDDEHMMPSEEFAQNNSEFMNSWTDKGIEQTCQKPSEQPQNKVESQGNKEEPKTESEGHKEEHRTESEGHKEGHRTESQGHKEESKGKVKALCKQVDFQTAQRNCQAALEAPAWAQCAARVDIQPYLQLCRDKFCDSGILTGALCLVFQDFGAACKTQGLKPPIWRNSSFC